MEPPHQRLAFRDATPDDIALLRRWDEQPHVVASDPNDDWQWETELRRSPPWREQLIAELDGRPIGFVQIIDPREEDSHYWGDIAPNQRALDIWIGDAGDLGKGYGSEMMRQVIGRCFSDPRIEAIWIDPLSTNERAHRFYERHGFVFVEQRRFGDDLCHVFRLARSRP